MGLGIACVQVCVCVCGVLGIAGVQVCVWGVGNHPCAGVVCLRGLGIARVQVCVCWGLGVARVQAGVLTTATCVGGWGRRAHTSRVRRCLACSSPAACTRA